MNIQHYIFFYGAEFTSARIYNLKIITVHLKNDGIIIATHLRVCDQ